MTDGKERSFNPTFADSGRKARQLAREMQDNLWNFPTLRISIDKVARAVADAEEAELEARHANAPKPVLHLYSADRSGALCGASLSDEYGLATIDGMTLTRGNKCANCLDLTNMIDSADDY